MFSKKPWAIQLDVFNLIAIAASIAAAVRGDVAWWVPVLVVSYSCRYPWIVGNAAFRKLKREHEAQHRLMEAQYEAQALRHLSARSLIDN